MTKTKKAPVSNNVKLDDPQLPREGGSPYGLLMNVMMSRSERVQRMLDPRRNIDIDCGYTSDPVITDYVDMYEREGIARRVVKVLPEECWQLEPRVIENEDKEETSFEKEWVALEKKYNLFTTMFTADVLSGIGDFGVILLGINDGGDLSTPLLSGKNRELLYTRVLNQSVVTVDALETDTTNERYGLPTMYSIQYKSVIKNMESSTTLRVHWSRVVHLFDNRGMSPVYGESRLRDVFNRLQDLRKVLAGSAEMYWQGAFPGLNFEVDPSLLASGDVGLDTDALKEEMSSYANGLQRWLKTVGVKVNSLSPQVVDPTPQVTIQLKAIAIAKGIPFRVFMGTEEGKLAGGQDAEAWAKRLMHRQDKYITPFIIRPLIDRLMDAGVLPVVEDYDVKWPSMLEPSPKEQADVAVVLAEAMKKYVEGGLDILIPSEQFLSKILGLDPEFVKEVMDEVSKVLEQERDDQALIEKEEAGTQKSIEEDAVDENK